MPKNNSLELYAKEEGKWYLKVCVADYAGNWSEASVMEYHRDITPPGMPNIIMPEIDGKGFLKSNTFNLTWESPVDDDVAGYTYGPLLGLYAFGLFTNYRVKDKYVPVVAILSPVICYILKLNSQEWLWGYQFGFEIILLNGLLTCLGLFIIRKRK